MSRGEGADHDQGTVKQRSFWLPLVACFVGVGVPASDQLPLWRPAVASAKTEARQATSTPRPKIDVSKLGPQVGGRVPDFSLKDQNGTTQTLHSIMGPKGAMLVFIRSADW